MFPRSLYFLQLCSKNVAVPSNTTLQSAAESLVSLAGHVHQGSPLEPLRRKKCGRPRKVVSKEFLAKQDSFTETDCPTTQNTDTGNEISSQDGEAVLKLNSENDHRNNDNTESADENICMTESQDAQKNLLSDSVPAIQSEKSNIDHEPENKPASSEETETVETPDQHAVKSTIYACGQCHMTYHRKQDLQRHLPVHAGTSNSQGMYVFLKE